MNKAENRTVAFSLPWDDMPIDISYIFEDEKPAGKHGFLTCKEGDFFFEDGTKARFWGTNFNSGANFPTHEYSETVARRLAKNGLNIVRFHQLDGDWSTPNIFQFSKGKRLENTRSLAPESMERLDYLIYALKKNGIYVYLDMITYRRFRSGDDVENAIKLNSAARPQSNFDPHLIELQKEFCQQIWTHYNPYTKLAYKDDPAIVMTEIANENEMLRGYEEFDVEPYKSRLTEVYQAWREERNMPPVDNVDFKDNSDRELFSFKVEKQKEYFDEMFAYMRSIGVKIPITGTNWGCGGIGSVMAQRDMSFMDNHTYFYGWKWTPEIKGIKNESFLGNVWTWLDGFPLLRSADKPYFISEWDEPWPNEFRSEGTLHLAAACALQGWAGASIHTYRYDCRPNIDMIAAPLTGEALAGVPYRSGIFDAFNDPCRFGLFYHAALILRRGDVSESSQISVVPIKELMFSETGEKLPGDKDEPAGLLAFPALRGASEITKTGVALPGTKLPPNAKVISQKDRLMEENPEVIMSDTGEICRNVKKRIATIDTPRTKAAYGFIGKTEEIQLKGMTIRCSNQFATIALSSLSQAPISSSDNILLTAVGNADNTDAKYNEMHTVMYDKGHGPIQAEVIEAEIELETELDGFHVEAVNTQGMLIGETPCKVENGKLKFKIGGPFSSIYYLIQKL